MSTRNELFAAMSTAIALRQGTVYVSEDGKTPVLHLDWIADHLLSQGWRPPMRVISTVEELEALPGKTVIEDGDGDPWIKAEAPLMNSWMYAGLEYSSENMFWGIRCPFRVVWEPEQ